MIVGTAGHIDHGKTSLVQALTGVDTDRLKEEKARGITIELGFAYWQRKGQDTIGFVDVPGHERLVHTMLAGATGIDFVMLVVAADDGVMPQTREHLAIIDLLGITRGVVALTKSDLADAEQIASVSMDITNLLAATGLAGAAIVPVSTVTGSGIGELRTVLESAAVETKSRATEGRFRLAVDRSFSLAGAGTVVTGTALSGRVAVGDRLIVSPSGLEARVRSIHAQNASATTGAAGQRCALSLVGPKIETSAIHRGDVVLEPSLHAPVKRIDANLALLAGEARPVTQWMAAKFHHGSAEREARIVILSDGGVAPGTSDFVQIVFEEPIVVAVGDRFVLRDIGATRTIGGGVVLDIRPPERHRRSPARRAELAALLNPDPLVSLANILAGERGFINLDVFSRDRAAAPGLAEDAAARLSLKVLEAEGSRFALLPETWERYAEAVGVELDRFHAEKPDLPGIGQEKLRLLLRPRLPAPLFSAALAELADAGVLVLDRSWLRRPHHEVKLSEEEERIWSRIVVLLGGTERFRPPRVRDIAKLQQIDEVFVRRLFKLAARRGDVDEVAHDHFFLADTVVEMANISRRLASEDAKGEFNVIRFRDQLDNGRKVAIQILEFFDRQGLTMRRGDIRRINPHKAELFTRGRISGAPRDGGESSPVGRPDFKSGEGRETALGRFDSCLLRQPTHGVRP